MRRANPILAEVTRGDFVETRHRGAAIVIDALGRIRMKWGNVEDAVFPRSMIKPMQAVSVVVSGAAEKYALSSEILALSAGSPYGEPRHVQLLAQWARQIAIEPEDIKCGPHKPLDPKATAALMRSSLEPTVFHNNNCGKHLSLLTIARHRNWPIGSYTDSEHPVQCYVREITDALMGWRSSRERTVVDTSGTPIEAIPLQNFARGLARMACSTALPDHLARGTATILDAMKANPELVTGNSSWTAWLVRLTNRRLIVKTGGEGGRSAIVPDEAAAVVVKIDDGSDRASLVVFADVLYVAGILTSAEYEEANQRYPRQIKTYCGQIATGTIRSCL